jgi:hypothetical protein
MFYTMPNDKRPYVCVDGKSKTIVVRVVKGAKTSINVKDVEEVEDGRYIFLEGRLRTFMDNFASVEMVTGTRVDHILTTFGSLAKRDKLGEVLDFDSRACRRPRKGERMLQDGESVI